MKKVLCSIVCVLCMLQLSAQDYPNIPNPGFESWDGLNPTGWSTYLYGDIVNINLKSSKFAYLVQMDFATKTPDRGNQLVILAHNLHISLIYNM